MASREYKVSGLGELTVTGNSIKELMKKNKATLCHIVDLKNAQIASLKQALKNKMEDKRSKDIEKKLRKKYNDLFDDMTNLKKMHDKEIENHNKTLYKLGDAWKEIKELKEVIINQSKQLFKKEGE